MVELKKLVNTHMNMGYTTNITKNTKNGSRNKYAVIVSRIFSRILRSRRVLFLFAKKILLSVFSNKE
jgi:hypothetical protein